MTINEIVGTCVVAVAGSGGAGWWAVKRVLDYMGRINSHDSQLAAIVKDMEQLKQDCRDCRKNMGDRLENGNERFTEHEKKMSETREDLLSQVNEFSEMSADMRERALREFVAEQNLEAKVIMYMRRNCKKCSGDQL